MSKRIKVILPSLLGIGLIYASVVLCLIFQGVNQTPKKDADTLMILGASVWGNTKDSARPSPVLRERLEVALPYIQKYPKTKIIVSGGQGSDEVMSEAECMKNYLISHGVSEKRIAEENRSTTTKENFAFSKKYLKGSTVVVTNDFHLYRAEMLARNEGIKNVSGLPAPSTTSDTFFLYVREVLALGYYLIVNH